MARMWVTIWLAVMLLGEAVDVHVCASAPMLETPEHDPVAAVRGLIARRMGKAYNDQIELRVIPRAEQDMDVFELGMTKGKPEIAGSSATAMAYGLQWYLKSVVQTQTDWDNHALQLPNKLPPVEKPLRRARSVKYSYYQNVCTVSYSSWTWGWPQWEKHIDWMAMNGINMPLAFTGQEKVWQNVFKKYYNISDAGLNKFFAGSAFLAWGRMGNIRGSWVKGPLPQKFIDDQFDLQLQIMKRYKEYGMIPALPAFAGHIPEELHLKYPKAKWSRSPNWGDFPEEFCCVYMLDPNDPLYLDIGKKFIQEQTRMLGGYTSSLYQCDTYNEMDPDTTDPHAVGKAAEAVYNSMQAGDEHAVWLMQGWLFMSSYWTKNLMRAYLTAVPNDRMIILDLYSEVRPIWNRADNYFGKSWIYCVLHNFGGNTGMRGDLETIGADIVVSRETAKGQMIGVGLTMEGIFQNYVVYDLSLQMAWEPSRIDPHNWIKDYAARRYHSRDESIQEAWQVLLRSVYGRKLAPGGVTKNIATLFPHWHLLRDGFMPTVITYHPQDVVRAWKHLLQASSALGTDDAFRHDLVDVTRQYLSDHLLGLYIELKRMFIAQAVPASKVCEFTSRLTDVIKSLEAILSTSEDFLLGNWISDAKALGNGNASLEEYLEYEARNQVTRWGDNNHNVLHDYACKEWAGLMEGYYLGRWQLWLTEVCHAYTEKRQVDTHALEKQREVYELKWQLGREPYPTTPKGDPIAVSQRLYNQYITNSGVFWNRKEDELAQTS